MFTSTVPIAGDAAAARAFAYLMAQSQPVQPNTPLPCDDLVASVATHFRWSIAAMADNGPPPRFGQFAGCNPWSPCVGCADGCSTQALVGQLQRHTGNDMLLLVVGGSFDHPAWARVHIALDRSPALSGVAVPLIDPGGLLSLAMLDNGFSLLPDRQGLIVKKMLQSAAMLEVQACAFRQRLRQLRDAVIALNDYHFAGESV